MAYQAKTRQEPDSPRAYLMGLEPPGRRADALALLAIFEQETGLPAALWTGGMIGFGQYDYRYDSGHSGRAMRVGFAPRKGKISLYTWLDEDQKAAILPRLGRHTRGVGCVYARRLADLDEGVLREMIRAALSGMDARYPRQPGEGAGSA